MLSGRRADTQKICSSSLYVGRMQYDMSASIWASIMIVRFEWIFCCKKSAFSCSKNEKKHSSYKHAIRISLRVFWNIRIWTYKNGHSKKWINMYSQNGLSKSPRRKEGMQQRYVEKNTISSGTWLHVGNNQVRHGLTNLGLKWIRIGACRHQQWYWCNRGG